MHAGGSPIDWDFYDQWECVFNKTEASVTSLLSYEFDFNMVPGSEKWWQVVSRKLHNQGNEETVGYGEEFEQREPS